MVSLILLCKKTPIADILELSEEDEVQQRSEKELELRLYKKAEDVKYTEQDEKFEHKFLSYLAITVLSLGILVKIVNSL